MKKIETPARNTVVDALEDRGQRVGTLADLGMLDPGATHDDRLDPPDEQEQQLVDEHEARDDREQEEAAIDDERPHRLDVLHHARNHARSSSLRGACGRRSLSARSSAELRDALAQVLERHADRLGRHRHEARRRHAGDRVTSRQYGVPSGARRKSTRATPAVSSARQARSESSCTSAVLAASRSAGQKYSLFPAVYFDS